MKISVFEKFVKVRIIFRYCNTIALTRKLEDQHFHFRFMKYQTIEYLPVVVQLSLEKGCKVESVNCILTGICKDCV